MTFTSSSPVLRFIFRIRFRVEVKVSMFRKIATNIYLQLPSRIVVVGYYSINDTARVQNYDFGQINDDDDE